MAASAQARMCSGQPGRAPPPTCGLVTRLSFSGSATDVAPAEAAGGAGTSGPRLGEPGRHMPHRLGGLQAAAEARSRILHQLCLLATLPSQSAAMLAASPTYGQRGGGGAWAAAHPVHLQVLKPSRLAGGAQLLARAGREGEGSVARQAASCPTCSMQGQQQSTPRRAGCRARHRSAAGPQPPPRRCPMCLFDSHLAIAVEIFFHSHFPRRLPQLARPHHHAARPWQLEHLQGSQHAGSMVATAGQCEAAAEAG